MNIQISEVEIGSGLFMQILLSLDFETLIKIE